MTETRPPSESDRLFCDETLRHDLLTPVNHILGYGEMLHEEAEMSTRPRLVACSSKIVQAGKAILDEINQVRPDGGGRYQWLDLQGLAARLPALMTAILDECQEARGDSSSAIDGSSSRDLERIELAVSRLKELIDRRIGDRLSDENHRAD